MNRVIGMTMTMIGGDWIRIEDRGHRTEHYPRDPDPEIRTKKLLGTICFTYVFKCSK